MRMPPIEPYSPAAEHVFRSDNPQGNRFPIPQNLDRIAVCGNRGCNCFELLHGCCSCQRPYCHSRQSHTYTVHYFASLEALPCFNTQILRCVLHVPAQGDFDPSTPLYRLYKKAYQGVRVCAAHHTPASRSPLLSNFLTSCVCLRTSQLLLGANFMLLALLKSWSDLVLSSSLGQIAPRRTTCA